MIRRDPEAAASRAHDLIVVGGGIHGVALALESARRGYRPLLLERDDFGGATSWNSLRIVHGGLRYLQRADLRRFRESVRERRWLLACYPELVKPLPCLMPLYGEGLKRPSVLRAALLLNDLLSWRRNEGLEAAARIPPGRVLSARETADLFPSAPRTDLLGGALWHDASMENAPRLLMELVRWACAAGATCLNYLEVRELVAEHGQVRGVRAIDRVGGAETRFHSPIVVNCAGPWSGDLARAFDSQAPPIFRPSIAFNVLVRREPIAPVAVAVTPPIAPGSSGAFARKGNARQTYFLRPWHGGMLAGTRHLARQPPGESRPTPEELRAFLAELNRALPELALGEGDVIRTYAGMLPATEAGSASLATRDVVHLHERNGGPEGLVSVAGVKYTTARGVAERTMRLLFGRGGRPARPGCEERPALAARMSLDEFLALEHEEPRAARDLLRRLVREEGALCAEDIVLRRTDWANRPTSDPEMIERVAATLGIPTRLVTGPT